MDVRTLLVLKCINFVNVLYITHSVVTTKCGMLCSLYLATQQTAEITNGKLICAFKVKVIQKVMVSTCVANTDTQNIINMVWEV